MWRSCRTPCTNGNRNRKRRGEQDSGTCATPCDCPLSRSSLRRHAGREAERRARGWTRAGSGREGSQVRGEVDTIGENTRLQLEGAKASLGLLKRAPDLHRRQGDAERARLLRVLVRNCSPSGGRVDLIYRTSFDLIVKGFILPAGTPDRSRDLGCSKSVGRFFEQRRVRCRELAHSPQELGVENGPTPVGQPVFYPGQES